MLISHYLSFRAIKGVRASVATEALVAIYHFLRDPLVDSSLSRLQSSLREAVSLAHLDRIIALGEIVEEVLANSHAGIVSEKELSENATPPFSEEKSVLWYVYPFFRFRLFLANSDIDGFIMDCCVAGRHT